MAISRRIALATLALLGSSGILPVRGDTTVDSWSLIVTVSDSSGGQPSTSTFDVVQNPFADTHTAAIGQSDAVADYNFSWGVGFGHFLLNSSQNAQPIVGVTVMSLSDGQVKFTPDEDLSFTVDATYSYTLPVAGMSVAFYVTLKDLQTNHYDVSYQEFDDTSSGAPVADTFSDHESGVLAAGHQYVFHYTMSPTADGSFAGLATGTGSVNFSFQSLPEPGTAGLLILPALLVVRTRRTAGVRRALAQRGLHCIAPP